MDGIQKMTSRTSVQKLKLIPKIRTLRPLRLRTNLIPYILITDDNTLFPGKNSNHRRKKCKRFVDIRHDDDSSSYFTFPCISCFFFSSWLTLFTVQVSFLTSNLMNEGDCNPAAVHDLVARVHDRNERRVEFLGKNQASKMAE